MQTFSFLFDSLVVSEKLPSSTVFDSLGYEEMSFEQLTYHLSMDV